MIVCPHCKKKISHLEYTFHVRRESPLGSFRFVNADINSAAEAVDEVERLEKQYPNSCVSWSVKERKPGPCQQT